MPAHKRPLRRRKCARKTASSKSGGLFANLQTEKFNKRHSAYPKQHWRCTLRRARKLEDSCNSSRQTIALCDASTHRKFSRINRHNRTYLIATDSGGVLGAIGALRTTRFAPVPLALPVRNSSRRRHWQSQGHPLTRNATSACSMASVSSAASNPPALRRVPRCGSFPAPKNSPAWPRPLRAA